MSATQLPQTLPYQPLRMSIEKYHELVRVQHQLAIDSSLNIAVDGRPPPWTRTDSPFNNLE